MVHTFYGWVITGFSTLANILIQTVVNTPWLPAFSPNLELPFANGRLPTRAFIVAPDPKIEPGFFDGEPTEGHVGSGTRSSVGAWLP